MSLTIHRAICIAAASALLFVPTPALAEPDNLPPFLKQLKELNALHFDAEELSPELIPYLLPPGLGGLLCLDYEKMKRDGFKIETKPYGFRKGIKAHQAYFLFDSSELSQASKKLLRESAPELFEKNKSVSIVRYTDLTVYKQSTYGQTAQLTTIRTKEFHPLFELSRKFKSQPATGSQYSLRTDFIN